jgi:putative tricarboxylic transport membrane protein
MKRDEIAGGVVVFLFGCLTVILSLMMPIGTLRAAGTGLFPVCLGVLLMLLSLLFLMRTFLSIHENRKMQKPCAEETKITTPRSVKQILMFGGVVILVLCFFNTVGFLLSAFFLMVLLIRVLGLKRWTVNIPVSLITAIGSYLLFVHWLKIPLPKGFLGL